VPLKVVICGERSGRDLVYWANNVGSILVHYCGVRTSLRSSETVSLLLVLTRAELINARNDM